MAIRVINNHDFEVEAVVETTEWLRLGEAKMEALQHGCNVMVRSYKGWAFKKVEITDRNNPEGLIKCDGKQIYII